MIGWVHLEYDVELKRQQLVADCEDFNILDAFRFLDLEGNKEVSLHDLKERLRNEISRISVQRTGVGLQFDDTDIISFIQRYTVVDASEDRQSTGNLKYSDFCAAIATKDRFYLNSLA